MSKLSPAAQAVQDAAEKAMGPFECSELELIVAAAFRALAIRINGADAIRQDILDIADELEGQP